MSISFSPLSHSDMIRSPNPANLRNIVVIWLETSFCLLDVPYSNPLDVDPDMLAALLRAIQNVAHDGFQSVGWKQHTILLETRERLLVVLIKKSSSDENSIRERSSRVVVDISVRFDKHPEWAEQIRNGRIQNTRECMLDIAHGFPTF